MSRLSLLLNWQAPEQACRRAASAALLLAGLFASNGAQAEDAPAYAPADAADSPSSDATAEIDPLDIPPEDDPLAHAFDRPSQRGGFYLRAGTSIGVHNTYIGPSPWEGPGAHAHGFGSGFSLDLGGLVAPWLAVHANSTLGVLWNGNVHEEVGITGAPREKSRVLAYGFAPAATFFTPGDFRLTGAFGVGMARIKRRSGSDTTDPGFYMNLVAGKDIVVSRNFSIGLDFQIVYMLLGNDAKHEDARVRQYLFGVSGAFDSI
jgi:hypothetical protein